MAYKIIIKKRFTNKLVRVLAYLEKEWSKKVADDFLAKVDFKINAIQHHPFIGSPTNIKNVRGVPVSRHNRMYYKVAGDEIIIINLFDTRRKSYPG